MPRIARIVIPGLPHHVTQRGNNHQDVFFVDDDRRVYLELLKQESSRHGLTVLGYCLMTNHVHLVAVPANEDSLAKSVGRTDFRYTQYINRLHDRSGHLWQNRYHSCPMDEAHLDAAMRYLECNPVRSGIVGVAWRHPWSSAAAHVGQPDQTGVLNLTAWQQRWKPKDWMAVLRGRQADDEIQALRSCTGRGRPLATDSFLSKLERRLGRRLRPLPVGRPRKGKRPADKRRGKK